MGITCPEWRRPTVARWRSVERSVERALWIYSNSNALECKGHARGNPSWRSSQLISTRIITKTISRMCSDKADIPSAIVLEMLYSTCIWETGKVKVFDLICHIISSVSTEWNWHYEHRQRGCSEQRLEVNSAINKGVSVHIGETYQAESWDWQDAVQIYVWPWWHYSCDLHFKPATEAAPEFKQAILHHIY